MVSTEWRGYAGTARLKHSFVVEPATLMEGGGLICMSSNSIHSGVKPENYVAMVKAIREYGKYPISI